MKKILRNILAYAARSSPAFRGKGRIILLLDRILTNYSDPTSYKVKGVLNSRALFEFDIRAWGQKFAFYYGEWEKSYIEILENIYLKKGGTFIDVGSSLGLYICCLGNQVKGLNGKIISIEPIPFNLVRQKHNVALNAKLTEIVTYVPLAVGACTGILKLDADSTGADNNAYVENDGEFEVDVRRLDDVISEMSVPEVGVIKMDVEGWEPEVLRGAKEMIRANRPVIFGEFLRERMDIYNFNMSEVEEFLVSELKYDAYVVVNEKLTKITDIGIHENIFLLPEENSHFIS